MGWLYNASLPTATILGGQDLGLGNTLPSLSPELMTRVELSSHGAPET